MNGLKIYLVDDDRDLANLTKIALSQKGHEVTIFHEALKVIEEAKRQKPDLILMDIMLPQISGGEVVRELRRTPELKNIPVIFLTALILNAEEDVEKAGITIDGSNYQTIGKPFEIDQLLKMVENITRQ